MNVKLIAFTKPDSYQGEFDLKKLLDFWEHGVPVLQST